MLFLIEKNYILQLTTKKELAKEIIDTQQYVIRHSYKAQLKGLYAGSIFVNMEKSQKHHSFFQNTSCVS